MSDAGKPFVKTAASAALALCLASAPFGCTHAPPQPVAARPAPAPLEGQEAVGSSSSTTRARIKERVLGLLDSGASRIELPALRGLVERTAAFEALEEVIEMPDRSLVQKNLELVVDGILMRGYFGARRDVALSLWLLLFEPTQLMAIVGDEPVRVLRLTRALVAVEDPGLRAQRLVSAIAEGPSGFIAAALVLEKNPCPIDAAEIVAPGIEWHGRVLTRADCRAVGLSFAHQPPSPVWFDQ